MAEILATAGTVLDAGAKIKEYVVTPIMDQLSYLFFYNSYIQSLRGQVEKLNQARDDLQLEVIAAERNGKVIGHDVRDWFGKVEEINKTQNRIYGSRDEVLKGCFHGLCPNLNSRYCFSREAKVACLAAIQLVEEGGKFTRISFPALLEPIPAAMADDTEFNTRKYKEEEIMAALKDDSVYMIGVCGMGGVGKTTMVKKIAEMVRETKLFEEVVMAVVSKNPDLGRVQQEIADGLGLKFEKGTLPGRATELHHRLKNAERVLIILDDVWKKMNLNELGIPAGSHSNREGRKIILTSRVQRVCKDMEPTAKIVSLEVLPEQEAWVLFREKAGGESVDAPQDFHTIAKAVAKECKGLPLALVTLGSALRNQSKSSWEDALLQLQQSIVPANIPEWLQDVYAPLKMSYDQLQSNQARYLFLLCSLFLEDSNIPIETLMKYVKGLDILAGTQTLGEARNRVYGLVEMLKSQFLLIEGDDSAIECVKMHDIVRDMAIFIASKDEHVFMVNQKEDLKEWPKEDSYDHYTCISLGFGHFINISLPEKLSCQRLLVLRMLFSNVSSNLNNKMPEDFFEGMRGLKVLEIQGAIPIPTSLALLTNLRVLNLDHCRFMTPTLLSKLENLEILSLRNAHLEVLPKEISLLKNLKSLDLTKCEVREIASGVISALVQLEELFMIGSFNKWQRPEEEKGKENRINASLVELSSLRKLRTLEIEIPDSTLIPIELQFKETLTRYFLLIGRYYIVYINMKYFELRNFKKVIFICLKEGNPLGELIHAMARKAECIYLSEDMYSGGVTDIAVNKLLAQDHHFDHSGTLKKLVIGSLKAVRCLWKCQSDYFWLSELRLIEIRTCQSLEFGFLQSAVECLPQLEKLEIFDCPVMEEIFKADSRITAKNMIRFTKLTDLWLGSLAGLNSFCKGIDGIEFPSMRSFNIMNAAKLAKFCSSSTQSSLERDHNVDQEFLFDQEITCSGIKKLRLTNVNSSGIFGRGIPIGNFGGLEFLKIAYCDNLRSVFSSSMFRGLTNLKTMQLLNCSMLEEVIAKDEEKDAQKTMNETLFPQLEKLVLESLPKCGRFCHIHNGLEFTALRFITMKKCHSMERFSLGSISLPSLEIVYHFSDPNLANKIFFNKERYDNIVLKNNCFWLPAGDLSINRSGDSDIREVLVPESRDKFAVAKQMHKYKKLEISGKFDAAKLSPGVLYEIVFVIRLEERRSPGEDFIVNLELKLPDGNKQHRVENLEKKPRGKWIEILAGEFTTGPEPNRDLEFALYQHDGILGDRDLFLRGVTIRAKVL